MDVRDKNTADDLKANKAYIDFIDKNYEYLYNKLNLISQTDQQINLLIFKTTSNI